MTFKPAKILCALLLVVLTTSASASMGLTELPGAAGDGPVTLFYPTAAAEQPVKRGVFDFSLAQDAPPVRGQPSESLLAFVKDRPGHDRRYAIDCRKAESRLGYRAAVRLDDGLASTIDWYLANEPWWRAVLDGSYRAADGA